MTLIQVIKAFEIIASHQPSVNMIVQNDIFRLNACSDARYGVFGWTQGIHSTGVDSNSINYQFTFFYVDRLTEDDLQRVDDDYQTALREWKSALRYDAEREFALGDVEEHLLNSFLSELERME